MRFKSVILVLALTCPSLYSSSAHALSLYAGILGGYGSSTENSALEPYAVALGGNAGLTLTSDFPLYLGGRLLWFSGDTGKLELMGDPGGGTASVEVSRSYLTYGVDVGYDLELGPIVLRPELGIGGATLYNNIASTAGFEMQDTSEGSLYLAPAAELLFAPGLIYLGGEVRYMALTASGQVSGIVFLAHLGLTI